MEPVLKVKNLSVRYRDASGKRRAAVEDVSFEILAGEVLGIAGESGCGKTTLAKALMGILPAGSAEAEGSILLWDQELASMDERELQRIRGAEMSLVSQESSLALSPLLTAGDQISEVLHAHKDRSWRQCRRQAEEWLARVGLEPTARFYGSYPHELSGGQLQRVALAQALACGGRLLIADEPTAALDARNQAASVALLRELKAEMGLSVLLISHMPEIHASLADRLLVMQGGRIIEQGSVAKLYWSPAHPYTRTMLRLRIEEHARPLEEGVGAEPAGHMP